MVTILVDATDIINLSGSRTAVYELYSSIFQIKYDWNFLLLVSKIEENFTKYSWVKQILIPYNNRFIQRILVQLIVLKYDLFNNIDIVHFARSIGGVTIRAKNIVSVFDVTSLKYPNFYPKTTYIYWKYFAPFLLSISDRIIAISQTVKSDLVSCFNVLEDKTDVVYCAPKPIFFREPSQDEINRVRVKYSLPSKYLLYLGILAKKKNLSTLINALFILKSRNIEFPPLVIAGGVYPRSDDYETIINITSKLGMKSDIIITGPVDDEDLVALFHGAFIFVYPSLHEGFGIPCLEAMACGVPVITTNSGAIPEIVGNAAFIISKPLDHEMFADAIDTLINDVNLRQELINRGITKALEYSWVSSAKKIIKIFESLI